MRRAALLLAAFGAVGPALAEDIVADLSQDRISISTNFDGSEILVFGAIKRDAPEPTDSAMAVIVTVTGPREDVTVRRKARRAGIWINTESVEVDGAPSFYAIAASAPLVQALTPEEDARYAITTPRAMAAPGVAVMEDPHPEYLDALIRVRTADGSYGKVEDSVAVRDGTLFSTDIALPADLVEGNYNTRIFLTRDGVVVDSYATSIYVQKVGLERWIYTLAHEHPFPYALLSLTIAISAGWGASAIFRYIRI